MITFKAVTPNKRRDGSYLVFIRVTFKGVIRRVATTLVCRPGDMTKSGKIKSADILHKADYLISRMQDAVKSISPFDLENKDVDWVVTYIKDALAGESFNLDFFDWADKYLEGKAPTTRRAYDGAVNAFARYLGKRSVDINAISRDMLLDFMDMVDSEPRMHWDSKTQSLVPSSVPKIAKGASTRHLAKLEHIFNAAKDRYNDEDTGRILIPRSPFSKITKVYPISFGQNNLGRELMQRLISCQVDNATMRTALDIFIVSFGLMGANMADLYYAKPFAGDEWIYNRQKTAPRRADRAEMHVTIPSVLIPYIYRLKGRGGWWLNELRKFASSKDYATARVNRCLAEWCEQNGIDKFTFYAARHTWATLARSIGIDKSTIDDCLVHKGSFQTTDIYAEKAWNIMQEANEKVLALFEW